jgi:hypothetical protein
MALTVTVVGKRNIGDRRAQLVDFAFVDPTVAGEAFTPEDAALHVVDAVLPEPYQTDSPAGTWSVAYDRAGDLLFLTKDGVDVQATTEDATVRALVVGI